MLELVIIWLTRSSIIVKINTTSTRVEISFRDFLGEWFFEELQKLNESGAERIVFWFNS